IKKLPLIGWFDRMLGALFGFIRGFLVVYLLLAVVTAFTAFNVENPLVKSINHSEFAKVMYNNNVFLDFVSKD
ncbi:MAG: CvpA family protein, partial [Clostridia bacterium]|nr:CvpA family protein [Clostridia bacterium]